MCKHLTGIIGDGYADTLLVQKFSDSVELYVEYFQEYVFADGGERNDFRQACQKLRTEILPHHLHDLGGGRNIAGLKLLGQPLASYIGCEQHDGVGEIPFLAQTVMQFSLVHDLQENVIYGRVRFLYFIKKDNGVWLLPYFIDQHAAFLISHISRRRSVQQGGGVFFLELGHVETDHGFLVIEQGFRQCFGKFGLAGTGGSQQEEGADGLSRLVHAATGFQDGIRQCLQGLVLSDDASPQIIFHIE